MIGERVIHKPDLRLVVPEEPERASLAARLRDWTVGHGWSLLILLSLLIVAALLHGSNMTRTPAFDDDEGTYVAQAWAVQTRHALAHYTYWYDHPPLGWLLLAAWTWTTGAFSRASSAVAAGREALLVVHLASCGLLYALGRRLGLRRGFASLAVLLFTLSPLALFYQRMVYLDNLATPFLLGAFVLALSPRRRLSAYAASGACFAAAVLIKETSVLLLPALCWQVAVTTDIRTRRYCYALFFTMFVLIGALYPLYALLKDELLPGTGHVSLVGGILFQLVERKGSGSLFTSGSISRGVVHGWWALDPWLLGAAVLLPPLAFAQRRLRPLALALAIQVLMPLRGGYLPVPYVIGLLPFTAVLAAGVGDWLWGSGRSRQRMDTAGPMPRPGRAHSRTPRRKRWLGPTTAVVAVTLFLGSAVPGWWEKDRALMTEDHAAPMRQAEDWMRAHAARDAWLLVDDAMWVDLVRAGFSPKRTVWFYKLDLDPGIRPPLGWRSIRYLVVTQVMRNGLQDLSSVRAAHDHSSLVATFGEGTQRVDIRMVR
jgi:Dolichyl-phosphate-mannose-protein mannosyltransferase